VSWSSKWALPFWFLDNNCAWNSHLLRATSPASSVIKFEEYRLRTSSIRIFLYSDGTSLLGPNIFLSTLLSGKFSNYIFPLGREVKLKKLYKTIFNIRSIIIVCLEYLWRCVIPWLGNITQQYYEYLVCSTVFLVWQFRFPPYIENRIQ
jgi:hypothetical protein